MSEEIFRQERKKIDSSELGQSNPLDNIKSVQEAMARESGTKTPESSRESEPFKMSGNMPPQLKAMMENKRSQEDTENYQSSESPPERVKQKEYTLPERKIPEIRKVEGSSTLEDLLGRLQGHHTWEEFEFPSKGKFYDKIPAVINVRAMTGEEEQILATPRWVKKGKAIDMIFRRCIKEKIDTEDLLSSDRTHLLIYLRGISYTPEYDVEIKCPSCGIKFSHVIDLSEMEVNLCPEKFTKESLHGTLPVSGFRYNYRLATGQDEQEVTNYKEKRIQAWGDTHDDDTLLYRTALLLEEIEGVTMKKELTLLLKKLPIQDVGYLRNEINTPPFGVDTSLPILCPSCTEEFNIDLPLETNFFFPRKKKTENQV